MKRTKIPAISPISPIVFWASYCVSKTVDHHEKWSAQLALSIDKSRKSMRGVSTQTLENDTASAIWLIEALYQSSLTGYPLGLRLGKLGWSEITSPPSSISPRAVRRAVDAAQKLGWINLELGTWNETGNNSISRLTPKDALRNYFSDVPFEWRESEPKPRDLLVMMRSEKGASAMPIDTQLNPVKVEQWRSNLEIINAGLLSHCLSLNCSNEDLIALKAKCVPGQEPQPLLLEGVQLRRIFNHNSLDCGGRFYGGWWITIPSIWRPQILIDNYLTVEVDFSGMLIQCLYAREGLQWGPEDPYACGDLAHINKDQRKIVKNLLIAIINDNQGQMRLKKADQSTLGMTDQQLKNFFLKVHAPIAKYFNSGIGVKMQFEDSQIAEQVLLRFTELGHACLPVHDSFIVRSDQQALLEHVMKEEFEKFTRNNIQLGAKEVASKKGLLDVSKINLGTSIRSNREKCCKHLAEYSVMNHYFETWRIATKSENDRWAEDMYLDEQFEVWKDSR